MAEAKDEEGTTLLKNILKERQFISKFDAGVIMLSLSFGSAVVVLPYTVKELGVSNWCFMFASMLILAWYCTQVLNHSMIDMIDDKKNVKFNDPYPELAEYTWGIKFRRIMLVTMYICYSTLAIGFILLSATLLNDLLPITGFHDVAQIRLWCLICSLLVSPLMFIGVYKDLVTTAYMAVATSSVALTGILVNIVICRFNHDIINFPTEDVLASGEIFSIFRQYGVLVFALSGSSYILPSIVVFMKQEIKIVNTISITFLVILSIYALSALLPYYLFKGLTLSSITKTFTKLMEQHKFPIMYRVVLAIVQLTISLHLLLVAVLVVNPVFRSIENHFGIPSTVFTLKRLVTRSVGLLIILLVCFLLPYFATVLSLVGALPLTLLAFVYPIIIHLKLFKLTIFQKIFSGVLLLFCFVMLFGNLSVVVYDIIELYRKNGFINLHS